MTSFILLLNITIIIIIIIIIIITIIIIIIIIDKTHNIYHLIYAASTYMILVNMVMVIKHFHDLLMNHSCH